MVNIGPRHVLTPHPHLMVAFTGLEGDVQSLSKELSVQVTSKLSRALGFMGNRQRQHVVSPHAMATLTSHILYGRKQSPFYVEPLVVGLERTPCGKQQREQGVESEEEEVTVPENDNLAQYRPFLCSHDLLGAQSRSDSFVCAGAASKSMYGTAEALWRPGLKSEDLARICGKAFLSAMERDCLSGYGALIYLITKDGIVEYDLATRND